MNTIHFTAATIILTIGLIGHAVAAPRVVIECPLAADTVGYDVPFRYALENPDSGRTYTYTVKLDKGTNACDTGKLEDVFSVGTLTCVVITLTDPKRYDHASLEFAIEATDDLGAVFCTRGNGERYVDPTIQGANCMSCTTPIRPATWGGIKALYR